MKTSKLLSIIGIVFLLSIAGSAVYAAISQEIYCTVIIQNLHVSVTSNNYPFGGVAVSGHSAPDTPITVTNDGNVNETYELKLAYAGSWTIGGAPADETFRMSAMFSTATNALGNYDGVDVLTTSNQAASATVFAITAEGVGLKGYSVPASATRELNFCFEAPTATTVTAQQYITVTITATAS